MAISQPISDLSSTTILTNNDLFLISKKQNNTYSSNNIKFIDLVDSISSNMLTSNYLKQEDVCTTLDEEGKIVAGRLAVKDAVKDILDTVYPIGSIYICTLSSLPTALNSIGSWQRISQGRCLWGTTDGSDVGTEISAGLPEISGSFWGGLHDNGYGYEGCFTMTGNNRDGNNSSDKNNPQVNFFASRSNPIYGNSTTVQPPALVVSMWKRTS